MPKVRSSVLPTAFSSGWEKLGQPVPLSNFVSEENSGRSQPAQAKMPLRCSFNSGLEPGRSVPSWRRISYCCGVSCARHSASVFSTSNFSAASAGEARSQRKAARPSKLATDASKIRRSIMMVSVRSERRDVRFQIRGTPLQVTPIEMEISHFVASSCKARQPHTRSHPPPALPRKREREQSSPSRYAWFFPQNTCPSQPAPGEAAFPLPQGQGGGPSV